MMQPVDYTTLYLLVGELQAVGVPARLEQVIQSDRFTLHLGLRTFKGRQWITCAWHPQAARLHFSPVVGKFPDTFTFSQQIWHQVAGLALVSIVFPQPWDRVVDLQFAKRPEAPVEWHLYLEIMGRHSNMVLVNHEGTIVTAAHQVSASQSRLRPVSTGDRYQLPPVQLLANPDRQEPFSQWQGGLGVLPHEIDRALLLRYRGLSKGLIAFLLDRASLAVVPTQEMDTAAWRRLFEAWQWWLVGMEKQELSLAVTPKGYGVVLHKEDSPAFAPLSALLQSYYDRWLGQEVFVQLHHRVSQALTTQQQRLDQKAQDFTARLGQSDRAETIRHQADLLMAHLHLVQPGMEVLSVKDFGTDQGVEIVLDPAQGAAQNAQKLYRRYQKQKRARDAISPLLEQVHQELRYLGAVDTALSLLDSQDLETLKEIQQELVQQGYLKGEFHDRNAKAKPALHCHRYQTPQGQEVWVGRNNLQNDYLTFKIATDYDLWFHALEISGSHVLLRLKPGVDPDGSELQFAANLAAFYSRARHGEQVAVVYTHPRSVYKPKGAKPGMVVYKNEQIIWGKPSQVTPVVR